MSSTLGTMVSCSRGSGSHHTWGRISHPRGARRSCVVTASPRSRPICARQRVAAVGWCWRDRLLRSLLAGRVRQGPALRRLVLHRGHVDRDLLPARAARRVTPKRENVRFYSDRGGRAAGRLPGLQALPPGRRAGLAGVGRPRGRRRAGHAADRRRRRRSRRRRRPRGAARLQRAPAAAAAASPRSARARSPLARAQRAQTARVLIETTELAMTDVAFAAGFASVRQFNATVREVFASTPTRAAPQRRRARPARARARRDPAAAAVPRAAVTPTASSPSSPRRACPASRRSADGGLPAEPAPAPRRGDRGARAGRRPVRAASVLADLRDLAAAVAALACAARPRLRSRRGRRRARRRTRHSRRDRARHARAPRARSRRRRRARRCARCSASRSRSPARAGPRRRGSSAAHGEPLDGPLGARDPRLPGGRGAGARPTRSGADAGRAAARCTGSPRRWPAGTSRSTPACDRTRRARRLLGCPGIGPWTVGVRRDARARDPDAFLARDLGVRRALERARAATASPAAPHRGARPPGGPIARTRCSTSGPGDHETPLAGRMAQEAA